MILMVTFDFGYRVYLGAVVEGTVTQAARLATVGNKTSADIDNYVKSQLLAFSKNAVITITKKSYSEFSGVGVPEKYQDSNNDGVYTPGVDCYFDDNHNNVRDSAATSGTTGLGGSDDVVFYSVQAVFPASTPVSGLMGWTATETVTSSTVMRNQPYGAQSATECTK